MARPWLGQYPVPPATYPGAHIRVQVTPQEDSPAYVFQALHDDGQASIVGEVGLGTAPWLGDLRETPFAAPDYDHLDRPFLTLEDAPIGQPLRTHQYGKHTSAAPEVGDKLAEIVELDTTAGAVVHPTVLARQMIALLTKSYDYGHPSIHLTSHVQNFARIPADTDVVLCGTFVDAFERNGHHVAIIDADLYSHSRAAAGPAAAQQHLQGPPRQRNRLNESLSQTNTRPRHGTPASPACSRLAGVRVLSMEQAAALPFATRHLADLGADVIRVQSHQRPALDSDDIELTREQAPARHRPGCPRRAAT